MKTEGLHKVLGDDVILLVVGLHESIGIKIHKTV